MVKPVLNLLPDSNLVRFGAIAWHCMPLHLADSCRPGFGPGFHLRCAHTQHQAGWYSWCSSRLRELLGRVGYPWVPWVPRTSYKILQPKWIKMDQNGSKWYVYDCVVMLVYHLFACGLIVFSVDFPYESE